LTATLRVTSMRTPPRLTGALPAERGTTSTRGAPFWTPPPLVDLSAPAPLPGVPLEACCWPFLPGCCAPAGCLPCAAAERPRGERRRGGRLARSSQRN
jgi:hypothetical protein